VQLPDSVSLEQGACLGVPAMTAYASLFGDGELSGLRVLVTGGAGAVGHYAIQFAKLAGASQVMTTVSGPEKAEHALKAHPDVIINYRTEDVVCRVLELTEQHGVDRISEVDFGVNHATTVKIMANNASIGAYGSAGEEEPRIPVLPFIFKDANIRFIQCSLMPKTLREQGTQRITRWCEENRLVHAVGRIYPLKDIVSAQEAVEAGSVIGNVLLAI